MTWISGVDEYLRDLSVLRGSAAIRERGEVMKMN